MFVQQGLPRKVAEQNNLPFTQFLNPSSPMWMGFADQQVDATAPANDVTFAGADGILFTTAQLGDYFDRGSLQHLSHDILDMAQFFDLNAAGVPRRGRDLPGARPVHVPLRPAAVHGPRRPVRQQRRPRLPPERLPGRRRRGEERGGHRHAARRGHRHDRAPDGPRAPACSGRRGRPTGGRSTCGTTGPVSTASTFPTGPSSRSWSSWSSCRRPSSSARCGSTRRRWTCRRSSTCPRRTTGSSGSSPPPGGRTS